MVNIYGVEGLSQGRHKSSFYRSQLKEDTPPKGENLYLWMLLESCL